MFIPAASSSARRDECRGTCFFRILRRVLDRAGYPEVALVSLNVRGIDRQTRCSESGYDRKALAAAVWGDTLAIVRDQLRPLEARPVLCRPLWQQW
jgi:predicted nucleotide-binding protein (sugar kinase/HSP70/actin superfamily)